MSSEKSEFKHGNNHPMITGRAWDLFTSDKITGTEFKLLAIICKLDPPNSRGCFAHNKKLAEYLDVHPKSITRMLERLTKYKLIKIEWESYRERFIKLTDKASWRNTKNNPENDIENNPPMAAPSAVMPPHGSAQRGHHGSAQRGHHGSAQRGPYSYTNNTHKKSTLSELPDEPATSDGDDSFSGISKKSKKTKSRNKTKVKNPGFIFGENGRKEIDENEMAARKLKDALSSENLISQKIAISRWKNEMRLLRKSVGEEMDGVLNWYCNNLNGDYIPEVFSAASFREKYGRIKKAKRRAEKSKAENNDMPVLEISDRAKKILHKLRKWDWPTGTDFPELEQSVERSYHRADIFIKKLRAFCEENPKSIRARFGNRFLREYNATELTTDWFRNINKKVSGWDNWNRSFRNYIFSEDHKEFKILGRKFADEKSAGGHDWDLLVNAMAEDRP